MTAENDTLTPFAAFGPQPRAGNAKRAANALYLGFDRALDAPGEMLALHVWTESWVSDIATSKALIAEHEALLERLNGRAHPRRAKPPRQIRLGASTMVFRRFGSSTLETMCGRPRERRR